MSVSCQPAPRPQAFSVLDTYWPKTYLYYLYCLYYKPQLILVLQVLANKRQNCAGKSNGHSGIAITISSINNLAEFHGSLIDSKQG